MNFFSSFKRFNILVIGSIVIMLLLSFAFLIAAEEEIITSISENFALHHADDIADYITTHVERDITLIQKMHFSRSIVEWLIRPEDASLIKAAYDDLSTYTQVFHDQNLFIIPSPSLEIYEMTPATSYDTFKPKLTLAQVTEDSWLSYLSQSTDSVSVFIGKSLIHNQKELWIGSPVRYNDQVIGYIGTSLSIASLVVDEIFDPTDSHISNLVIDAQGRVQMNPSSATNELGNIKSILDWIPNLTEAELNEKLSSNNASFTLSITDGLFDFVALSHIEKTPYYVATFYEKGTFFSADYLQGIILATLLVTALFILFIGHYVKRYFVTPFTRLLESIERKNVYYEEPLYGLGNSDEFGILAENIERMSERIVNNIPVGVFVLDDYESLAYANRYFLDQFKAASLSEARNRLGNATESFFVIPEDFHKLLARLKRGESPVIIETQMIDFEGNLFWCELHFHLMKFGEQLTIEGLLVNVENKKRYEQQLINLATTDTLTKLVNRMRFDEIVLDEILRSERYGGPLSLIIFDLDHFKRVNDTFGHIIGDEVLITVAELAKSSLRTADVIARWGGEEFALLLPGTDVSGAKHVAEKLRTTLEQHRHDLIGQVTASFGVAQRNTDESYLDWFNRVDRALFASKSNGRNRVTVSENVNTDQAILKINWVESFASGNQIIDDQHKSLFTLANQFIQTELGEKSNLQFAERVYDNLLTHFIQHTQFEERLMVEIGFPEALIVEHHQEHQNIIDRLTKGRSMVADSPSALVLALIKDVVLEHMLKDDVKFYPYINS